MVWSLDPCRGSLIKLQSTLSGFLSLLPIFGKVVRISNWLVDRSAEIDNPKITLRTFIEKPNLKLAEPIHVSHGLATSVCDNEIKPSCNGQGVALCNYCVLSGTNAQRIRFFIGIDTVGLLAKQQRRSVTSCLQNAR